MELFSELHKQGITIIMITHSDEIASYADRVIKIVDGQILDEHNHIASQYDDIEREKYETDAQDYGDSDASDKEV